MARWEPDRAQIQLTASRSGLRLVSPAVRGTVNLAKARVPRDTGRTANGIGSSIRNGANEVRGRVVSRARHSMALHEGAKPHKIRPRRPGGRLKFYWARAGRVVYLASVNHPGIGGTPFLTSAMTDSCRPLGFVVVRNVSPDVVSEYL